MLRMRWHGHTRTEGVQTVPQCVYREILDVVVQHFDEELHCGWAHLCVVFEEHESAKATKETIRAPHVREHNNQGTHTHTHTLRCR